MELKRSVQMDRQYDRGQTILTAKSATAAEASQ